MIKRFPTTKNPLDIGENKGHASYMQNRLRAGAEAHFKEVENRECKNGKCN